MSLVQHFMIIVLCSDIIIMLKYYSSTSLYYDIVISLDDYTIVLLVNQVFYKCGAIWLCYSSMISPYCYILLSLYNLYSYYVM